MRVLISGAGIAGPSLAFWLHRAGAEVTVVEKAPGPRPGGQTVDIRGIAREAVERMGLMGEIKAARTDERGIALVGADGRRTAAMTAEAFGGEGVIAEIEIARGDLAAILYRATADDVTYRFGDRVTGLTQDADGVDVTFSGQGRERYDVVVGADGVHSGVRGLAFGPEKEFVHYLGAAAGYFTVTDPVGLDGWAVMFNAPGGKVAMLRPVGDGRAMAGLSFTAARQPPRMPVEREKDLVVREFAGVGWQVPKLLADLPTAGDFFFDEYAQVRVETWARGRVVLLGDAGYCGSPLGGMGTAMSIVGGYVLAGELSTTNDPIAAFAAYQRRMTPYVRSGTRLPAGGIKGFAPQGALAIRLRALSWAMMGHWPMHALMRRMTSRADAIALPEYGAALGHDPELRE